MSEEMTPTTREILTYLRENPEAQDTLEGMIHWWLLDRHAQRGLATVRRAVDDLVTRGFLIEREGKGCKSRFGLNHEKLPEIESALAAERHTET